MARIRITKTFVDKAQPKIGPDGKPRQALYWDDQLRGFGLLVSAKAKTFIVQRDIHGRTVRSTVARYGHKTVDEARKEARQLLAQMARNINPTEEKRRQVAEGMTLQEALDLYMAMPKKRSEKTMKGYRDFMDRYLKTWMKKPLSTITPTAVRERHRAISEKHGPYSANATMRILRAVWNRAQREHYSLGVNPVFNVDWNPEKRREAVIPTGTLADWYQEVMAMDNHIRRDYLRLVLFTGLRRESAACLTWDDVDFDLKILHVATTKGDKPFDLPLTKYLIHLLKERREGNQIGFANSPYIFPAFSKSGHLSEPKEKLNVKFTIHGLRNTFATVGTAVGVNPFHLKLLLNHAVLKSDVTMGYINPDVDALRRDMEKISKRLQELCSSQDDVGNVIQFKQKKRNKM